MKKQHCILILLALAAVIFSCKKEEASPKYFPRVKTIVADNCTISCHAPSKGLHEGMPVVLETDEEIAAIAGGIKAAVADPASPQNKRMPQGGMLPDADIDTIVKWFNKGGRITD